MADSTILDICRTIRQKMRMRFNDDEKTRWRSRQVVAADILGGLGKGFLIACAGIIVGVLIGTSPLAAGRVLTILGAGTVGAACMGVVGVLREHEANTRIARCDPKSPSTDNPYVTRMIPDTQAPSLVTENVSDRRFVELVTGTSADVIAARRRIRYVAFGRACRGSLGTSSSGPQA